MSGGLYAPRRCGVGPPGRVCGAEPVAAIAVHAVPDVERLDDPPTFGALLLCQVHFTIAAIEWQEPS